MTETTIAPPGGPVAPECVGVSAAGAGLDLRDLDTRGVLELVTARRRAADRAEADLLAAVVHLVDLHPVLDPADPGGSTEAGSGVAAQVALNDQPLSPHFAGPSSWGPVGGAGCPRVTEDGVMALGAALNISYRAALALVGETLELCYRLPRLWALVQAGHLQAWKARRVARETPFLSTAAVAFVDRHLAVTGTHNHLPHLGPVLTLAINRCDPDLAEGHQEAALENRHVTFDYATTTDTGATADLTATLDILDAHDLDTQITQIATTLAHLGDSATLNIRRSRALGILANPQHTLHIFGPHTHPTTPDGANTDHGTNHGTDHGTSDSKATGPTGPTGSTGSAGPGGSADQSDRGLRGVRGGIGGRLHATGATLYLHLTTADLATHTRTDGADGAEAAGADGAGRGCGGAATVETLNSITLTLLHDWLQRTDHVTIRPVLDPTRTDAVDAHDPPPWMREAAILRDQHCVFPGCRTNARSCDLDHITPYHHGDPTTGQPPPPGQTSLTNLACLCRRHHRLKTRSTWQYRRLPDHTYQWTSPHGHVYTTHPPPPRL